MPITHDFKYLRPTSLDEALKTLAEYGESARILAGGTDLINKMKEGFEDPNVLIDIKNLDNMKEIVKEGLEIHIGANVTFSELIKSKLIREELPLIWEASNTVASVGTRNRATMVGNICSAVPSLDSGPALLNYDAVVCLKSVDGERQLPITQWFAGPKKTMRKPNELVTGIIVPVPQIKHAVYYNKLSRYAGEDLAQAGVGIIGYTDKTFHIAFCAVGPVPKRSEKLEALLNGKDLNDELIEKCKNVIEEEISPISDIRSTKEYRMHMVKVMFERGLKQVVSQL